MNAKYACPVCLSTRVSSKPERITINGKLRYTPQDAKNGKIFCFRCWTVILSASDMLSADRVRSDQEREVIRVLSDCAPNELTVDRIFSKCTKQVNGGPFNGRGQVKNTLRRLLRDGRVEQHIDSSRGWYRVAYYTLGNTTKFLSTLKSEGKNNGVDQV